MSLFLPAKGSFSAKWKRACFLNGNHYSWATQSNQSISGYIASFYTGRLQKSNDDSEKNNTQHLAALYLINPLGTGPDHNRFFVIIYQHIKYQLLNMLKVKRDINQQDFKSFHIHYVKSE